ncbi:hypothetical protein LTR08_007807 [Meristemomyces frigidus]|nr:hypothetical protein LTR08_007807 [Meristemomyces frigidus]
MATLPAPRLVVAGLISGLPEPRQESLSNPLSQTPGYKEALLTLHVLFPNELLPALDLLDRGLITRLRLTQTAPRPSSRGGPQAQSGQQHGRASPSQLSNATDHADQDAVQPPGSPTKPCTYYVRSAQQQTPRGNSRYRNAAYEHTTYYEVRINAWSCSCPAFAFSAFPATLSGDHDTSPATPDTQLGSYTSRGWRFGGLSRGTDMPVCKHLLACVLVEHSSTFAHFVEERVVTAEEMAGWAAGWGD